MHMSLANYRPLNAVEGKTVRRESKVLSDSTRIIVTQGHVYSVHSGKYLLISFNEYSKYFSKNCVGNFPLSYILHFIYPIKHMYVQFLMMLDCT